MTFYYFIIIIHLYVGRFQIFDEIIGFIIFIESQSPIFSIINHLFGIILVILPLNLMNLHYFVVSSIKWNFY